MDSLEIFMSNISIQGNFALQRTFGKVWRHFCNLWECMLVDRVKARILLNSLNTWFGGLAILFPNIQ